MLLVTVRLCYVSPCVLLDCMYSMPSIYIRMNFVLLGIAVLFAY